MNTISLDQIKRVVVRTPNWVGDAVMCLPALREVRRLLPDAQLSLVSRPGTADLFLEADFADQVIVYERSGLGSVWNQIGEWKRAQFDLAVLFQNAFEAAAIAFMARVPLRIGYDSERRGFLLTHPIPLPAWKEQRHEVFYYLNIVAEAERAFGGISPREPIEPEFTLSISEERKRKARELLHHQGIGLDRPLVLLCPGSINSRAKRWPADRFAALADRLSETGAIVGLIGSPGELEVSKQVLAMSHTSPILFTGKTSVAEVAALISIADLLVTNDTGPAHIGTSVGTPTLVIFGPTNPLTTRPFGPLGEIIRQPPDCAPCMLRDCPIDHRCMTAITPADVFVRASKFLRPRLEVTA